MGELSDKRNKGAFGKSAVSGGHVEATKDAGAGPILASRVARDVFKTEFIQDGSSVLSRTILRIGRPFEYYWPAAQDENDDGTGFYGFFASVFPTTTHDDGTQRLLYCLGDRQYPPRTGAGYPRPRATLVSKHAIVDVTSRGYEQERVPSRVRELPVARMWGLTAEGSNRAGRMTLEEPLLITSWRSDARHSNLAYDVENGELSRDYIARVSDLLRISLNERDVPALSLNFAGAPDNPCVGHGMAYGGAGVVGYASATRGGPLFTVFDSRVQHGGNLEGTVVGMVLKFLNVGAALSGSSTAPPTPAGSGSIFYGSPAKQGPIAYDNRDFVKGRGVRKVEAWPAWDENLSWEYPICGGTATAKGGFRMNSWVNEFDPYDPGFGELLPPEDEEIPEDPWYIHGPGNPGLGGAGGGPNGGGGGGGGSPSVGGDGQDGNDGNDGKDGDITGGKGKPAPAIGVTEQKRPSIGGIPIPPRDSAGDDGVGDIAPIGVIADRQPRRPEDGARSKTPSERAAEEAKRRIEDKPKGAEHDTPEDIKEMVRRYNEEVLRRAAQNERSVADEEYADGLVPSQVERAIGIEYGSMVQGSHISNTVWYDRFTLNQTQRSIRNMVRAPHVGHIQTVAKYDSSARSWDVDANTSCYADASGNGTTGAPTITNTIMVMPPNIDLGQADINPSSGVSVQGFAVHRGNDNGFIGVGVPHYATGGIVSGFAMTYDGDVQINALDSSGGVDGAAKIYFNGVELASGGGTGDVIGPASATDNAIARFNSTTGKSIQNSGVIIDDSDNITGVGTLTLGTALAVTSGGTGATTAAGARTNLGVAIGSDVQAYDAGLQSIAGLTTAADKGIYTTASDTYATYDLTSYGRTLAGLADAAALRTNINVEDGATADQSNAEIEAAYNAQVGAVSQGDAEAGTSTTVTRWTAQRVAQAIAALGFDGDYDSLSNKPSLFDGDYDSLSNKPTLGSAAAEDTTAFQAADAELAAIAGLTSAANKLPYFTGLGTAALADLSSYGRTLIALADAAALRSNINVEDGATADQSGSEIKSALFAEADTNNLTDTLKSNYDTAYGWGDHSGAGYLTGIADEAVTLAKMAHIATARFLGRVTAGTGDVEALTKSEMLTALNIEDGADVTDATNVAAAGAVMKSLFDANTIIAATSDNTPAALTVGEQTLVGRITGGNIAALTPSQIRTLINVADGATAGGGPRTVATEVTDPSASFTAVVGYHYPINVTVNLSDLTLTATLPSAATAGYGAKVSFHVKSYIGNADMDVTADGTDKIFLPAGTAAGTVKLYDQSVAVANGQITLESNGVNGWTVCCYHIPVA